MVTGGNLRFLGIAVCILLSAMLLKDKKRLLASLLSLAGCCVLLIAVTAQLKELTERLQTVAESVPTGNAYIGLMLRVLAITLLTRLVSDICRDNGENALAGVTEFTAKIAVTALVLPVFETVITIVSGLIQ